MKRLSIHFFDDHVEVELSLDASEFEELIRAVGSLLVLLEAVGKPSQTEGERPATTSELSEVYVVELREEGAKDDGGTGEEGADEAS